MRGLDRNFSRPAFGRHVTFSFRPQPVFHLVAPKRSSKAFGFSARFRCVSNNWGTRRSVRAFEVDAPLHP